jgi:hypothetical protein
MAREDMKTGACSAWDGTAVWNDVNMSTEHTGHISFVGEPKVPKI